MKKRNIINKIAKVMAGTFLAAIVLSAFQPAMAAYADVNESEPSIESETGEGTATAKKAFPDLGKTGSIETILKGKVNGNDVTIYDSTLELIKVADVAVDDGFRFKLLDAYKDQGDENGYVDPEITEDEFKSMAAALDKQIGEGETGTAYKLTEKDNGKHLFDELELGLYLIRQRDAGKYKSNDNEYDMYETFTPFLVTVPYYYEDSDGDGKLDPTYDIKVKPKAALEQTTHLDYCQADPPVQKIVKTEKGEGEDGGDTAAEGEFVLIFERGDEAYPLPPVGENYLAQENDKNSLKLVFYTNAEASGEFGTIEFKKAGEYIYYIYEDESNLEKQGYTAEIPGGKYSIQYNVKINEDKNGFEVKTIDITAPDGNKRTLTGGTDYDPKDAKLDASIFTITNRYAVTEINAQKAWKNVDGSTNAPDGAWIEFTLYADGIAKETVKLDGKKDDEPEDNGAYESENWKATFPNYPKYKIENGERKLIEYTVGETTTWPGYTSDAVDKDGNPTRVESGGTITNTEGSTKTYAIKAWANSDKTTTAPKGASVVFTLYADNEKTDYTVILDGTKDAEPSGTAGYESASWRAEFVNLPRYKIVDGKEVEIKYTIAETTGYDGYEASNTNPVGSGSTITNTEKKKPDPTPDPGPDPKPHKQSERTPSGGRVTPPASDVSLPPEVAGAYRVPDDGVDAGVLGAARSPQAVLGASRLPQTGQFWWPVPVLMIAGITLMAGGLVKRRHDE